MDLLAVQRPAQRALLLGHGRPRDGGRGEGVETVERTGEIMQLDGYPGREHPQRVGDALVSQGVELGGQDVSGRQSCPSTNAPPWKYTRAGRIASPAGW